MFRSYPRKENETQTSRCQDPTPNMELIGFYNLKNANEVWKTYMAWCHYMTSVGSDKKLRRYHERRTLLRN